MYWLIETEEQLKEFEQQQHQEVFVEVIPFDKELSGNQWKHYGTLQAPNGEKDIIDELWRPLILSQTSGDFDLD